MLITTPPKYPISDAETTPFPFSQTVEKGRDFRAVDLSLVSMPRREQNSMLNRLLAFDTEIERPIIRNVKRRRSNR